MAKIGIQGARYSREVRDRAKALYMEFEYSFAEIVRILKKEFDVPLLRIPVISNWQKRENWEAERDEVHSLAVQKTKDAIGIRLSERALKQLEDYEKMQQRGSSTIGKAIVRSAGEAASLIDTGIKGQRVILNEALQMEFLMDIARIIKEEISDEELLGRLALRFNEVMAKYKMTAP